MGTVFKFGVGAVDLGAQLDSISQYPGEGEILYPPLSHLEVIGHPKVEIGDKVQVLVVSVKVNINQKAMTIDEILRRRKHTVTALVEGVVNDIAFDSQIFTSNTWQDDKFRQSVKQWTLHDDQYFNADNNFKDTLDKILALKKETIIQFVQAEMKDADETKRETTLHEAATRGKTEIIQALVSMGVDVNTSQDYDRKATVILAAEYGHSATVTALAGLGADVKAADNDGRTAVILAAQGGHTATVTALAELGADVKAADNTRRR